MNPVLFRRVIEKEQVGTYKIVGRETILNVLDEALKVGYRSIDTAAVYRNEEDIGRALQSLLPKYNLTRENIFITTKLSPIDHGDSRRIEKAVHNALTSLKVSYIDLFLIHWPGKSGISESSSANREFRSETWKTLVKLKSQGLLRSIGVSNYNIKHLGQLLENCYGIRPAVNQVECHPHYKQTELIKFCEEEGIHVQAYSSLGTSNYKSLLKDPIVCRVANELAVSPARVLLKWALQQNIGIIPKAVQKVHIRDNFQLQFKIHDDQMIALSSLTQTKYAWDPDNVA
ncbi:NADPH-dependent aldo-keto reductase, chloroplastic-like isoform X2 [Venturia canescens]|uniref:NADPH-dependent aldo-keto reductase, chloroplastic-like isoform X2 n=1 Tax=Venturia canescens TaxID=32260 RepID=UPI001C9C6B93|nr:NADPH-dependent aldo-keto reductase, chloroplastic-like isoform X2 [Venturia canescens]